MEWNMPESSWAFDDHRTYAIRISMNSNVDVSNVNVGAKILTNLQLWYIGYFFCYYRWCAKISIDELSTFQTHSILAMDNPAFKSKYHKYKTKVKLWEKSFKELNGRVPSKVIFSEILLITFMWEYLDNVAIHYCSTIFEKHRQPFVIHIKCTTNWRHHFLKKRWATHSMKIHLIYQFWRVRAKRNHDCPAHSLNCQHQMYRH